DHRRDRGNAGAMAPGSGRDHVRSSGSTRRQRPSRLIAQGPGPKPVQLGVTYRMRPKLEQTHPQSGIFLKAGSRASQAPNVLDFVDEIRWLTTPAVAAAVVDPLRGSPGVGVIASSAEVTTLFESRLRLWLAQVERTLILE